MDFQEDNLGYTLRETYVDIDNGDRIQKSYFARIDSTTNTPVKEARYMVSHTENGKPDDIFIYNCTFVFFTAEEHDCLHRTSFVATTIAVYSECKAASRGL